ncbi:MAG: DUF1684 domain-containing protein [Rhodanobacter sp.]|jgi:uncharacterized protein (DUF1684 family)|nr:DUF1684 domain-containing protein [Rhodanobacter sp.]
MFKTIVLFTAVVCTTGFAGMPAVSAATQPVDAYAKEIQTWRAQRVERLQAPNGWLSLIGLHWLAEGRNTVGSAKDNDIVLAKGPARIGVLTLKDGKARIELDARAGATIDGTQTKSAELLDDSHDKPTSIAFGTVAFYLIDRNGKKGLRVKDSQAHTRTQFLGLDDFPIDPSWRIQAQWVPFAPAHTLETPNVLGQIDHYPVPGKAVFTRDGKTYEVLPVIEVPGDKELFLIFADRTSGKETYGAARFLYAPMPSDGKIVLDFNKAYNPPCAFTPYATCPLAPPENRLDLAVTAGEKKYRGGHP